MTWAGVAIICAIFIPAEIQREGLAPSLLWCKTAEHAVQPMLLMLLMLLEGGPQKVFPADTNLLILDSCLVTYSNRKMPSKGSRWQLATLTTRMRFP